MAVSYDWMAGLSREDRNSSWPAFTQTWFGGEYPAGRGTREEVTSGWQCPGCSRCYGPAVRQCAFCGPGAKPAAAFRPCPKPQACGVCGCAEGDSEP